MLSRTASFVFGAAVIGVIGAGVLRLLAGAIAGGLTAAIAAILAGG